MDTPNTLAAALLAAGARTTLEVRAAVRSSAEHVKSDARKNALQSAPTRHAGAPYAIGYNTAIRPTGIEAVIGYDKNKPGGALGNLLEFGGGKDHSPPHRDLGRALDAEEPKFLDAITRAGLAGLTGKGRRR